MLLLAGSAAALMRAPVLRRSAAPAVAMSRIHATTTLPGPAAAVAPEDEWTQKMDYPAFQKEVAELGDRLEKNQGPEDVAHLRKMCRWSNICGGFGMLTMWSTSPVLRPLSVFALSLWTMSRWTMIAHHTCHGGYNRQDDGSGRFTSKGFALGSTYVRARDWFDWMLPEAWNVEHNNLHHYRLGEAGDPDLVERNLDILRTFPVPTTLKYSVVALLAAVWKWYYYAPNTYKQLKIQEMKKKGEAVSIAEQHAAFTLVELSLGEGKKFGINFLGYFRRVMGPYLLLRFLMLPAPLALINPAFYFAAVSNLFLADVISNIHSFIIIATNHAGDDLYKFKNSVAPKSGSFFMRAVTSGVNFRTANGIDKDGKARNVHGNTADANDFMHGWLNYQIEHHVWPQLSMLSYQKAAPELRAICAKYGVPYVQQNVFKRLKKTADIMVGATSMRKFDESWEYQPDKFLWK